MPLKPVHGDFRNALFYDWHVGRLSTEMEEIRSAAKASSAA